MANCCTRTIFKISLSPCNFTFPVDSAPVLQEPLAAVPSPLLSRLSDKPSGLMSAPHSSSSTQKPSPDWQLDGKDDDYEGSLTTQSEANWQ